MFRTVFRTVFRTELFRTVYGANIASGSLWGHFGVTLGVDLGSILHQSGTLLEQVWDTFGTSLGPRWEHFGTIFGQLFGGMGVEVGGGGSGGLGMLCSKNKFRLQSFP